MPKSEYLSQGVNYLGFLSQQLGDLRGITTLAHELIQNADDAKNDAGELSATQIIFDIQDDALVVSNDAVFREKDFERMRQVASGSKRDETGDRTTGVFGVGFISVYQVTDRPEIDSAGRRWALQPKEREDRRIVQVRDTSITKEKGTVFKLPWAFNDSQVRRELKVSKVDRDYINSFVDELSDSLPQAILFLKKLDTIELRRNGRSVRRITRIVSGNTITVECDGASRQVWRILKGHFTDEALKLKARFSPIENNREDRVRIAIPDTLLDDGLLFATLPTEQPTGLPFHIDADFFPTSDRKSIAFEDTSDHRSEWNRAVIRAAASIVSDNLISLRDMFKKDASTFWAFLECLHDVYSEHRDNTRKPLGNFWNLLRPSLQKHQIVYAESKKWLTPNEVRIPTGTKEVEAVPAFEALGIEIVHRNIRPYRNILTSNGVSVLRVKDICEALQMRGLTEQRQPVPSDFRLEMLWEGIHGVLENTQGRSARQEAEEELCKCALALGLDGHLWPCGSVYRADARTRKIFANLMPDDVSFLTVERTPPLLKILCPQFVSSSAIKELERLDADDFQAKWREGLFRPRALLKWFDDNKAELSEDAMLCERLAEIPIFPSAEKLCPLRKLYLPGGFNDPIGVADLVDVEQLKGLSDFLKFLGARELTFEDYAREYIPRAFSGNTRPKTKNQLLDLLATRIGEISENDWLKDEFAKINIVECADGEFRRPGMVYFLVQEVQNVLGDFVHYARPSGGSKARKDLYRWLGVKGHPRPKDVLTVIDKLTSNPPSPNAIQAINRILEAVGKTWDVAGNHYDSLKNKAWLLAERGRDRWYRPNELYATFNKNLFESQAQFIDLSYGIQQQISGFLRYLGVNLSPQPSQVVRHLIECCKHNNKPPNGIYQWLNSAENAQSDLYKLRNSACLCVEGEYLRPDQVFWGKHPFGRFRVQLGPDFRAYQNLLEALEIREASDHNDAIQVLKEIPKKVGNNPLNPEDNAVVLQCWIMLAEALEKEKINEKGIKTELEEIKCVPNIKELLQPPSWMFLEDRPGLADKFGEHFQYNLIQRTERIWQAMEAAGVRPISDVVRGDIHNALNQKEDKELKERTRKRTDLIKTISKNAIQLDSIRFFRTDQLEVKWHTEAFNSSISTKPESVSAHLESSKKIIYFASQNDSTPWAAIARELTQAIAPGDEISRISPGLKIILEADSRADAVSQLHDLGIALTEELRNQISNGKVAEAFGETSDSPPVEAPSGDVTSGDTEVKTPEIDQPLEDDKDSTSSNASTSATTGSGLGTTTERPTDTRPSSQSGGQTDTKQPPRSRPFISYVATHPDDKEADTDNLDHKDRMALEEKAIKLILAHEPEWQPTDAYNPGFDLFQVDEQGQKIRWCEVKAMTGSLQDRPVGLSRKQFDYARKHGEAYWLYIVECAGDGSEARIVRIQDPAGKARTFTFDHGWLAIADVGGGSAKNEES